jgi:pimeloyl-ACP methyl ester carboxylesterase
MPYINTSDDQVFYVRDLGPKNSDKPPIILLHGFGMQSLHWLPFALPLARKQRFIIPDFRGFGQSHHVNHDRECVISNYADDLQQLIKKMKLDRFKLAGISMGAFIALKYQEVYGDDHVARYLHIDQSPRCINKEDWHWGLFGGDNKDRLTHAAELIEKLEPYARQGAPYHVLPDVLRKELRNELAKFYCDALSRPSHKSLVKRAFSSDFLARKILPVDNWPVYITCLKAYIEQDYNMVEVISKLNNPLTLVVGLKSTMYPSAGQLRIADHHQDCEVQTFRNSGHTPLIDQPLQFLKTLKGFAQA